MPLFRQPIRFLALLSGVALWLALATPFAAAQFGSSKGGKAAIDKLPEAPATAPKERVKSSDLEGFEERAIISSRETIRTEGDVAYAGGRTKVEYNEYTLEADRMVIDFVSEEIQAEGNVIFTSPNEFVKGTAGRFNLATGEGVAYGVDGQSSDMFFVVTWDETKNGPGFRQISERESNFRGTRFTSCEFPVPHYYVEATEVILLKDRRIYFRNPVVYVRGFPVLWLPWYSRNLAEGSPWSVEIGYTGDLGAYMRIGYRFIHKVQTPRFDKPGTYETRSHGQADAKVDLMTKRGIGAGMTYRYQFDYYRHTGMLDVYGLRDRERDVSNTSDETEDPEDGDKDSEDRWIYRHKHNSLFGRHWLAQLDVDKASDPDIYVDVLDRFQPDSSFERGRLFEQRERIAFSYLNPNANARLLLERKERLGRDRYLDPSRIYDDDLDFDPDTNFFDDEGELDGISNGRYGTVTRRAIMSYGTRLLNLASSPLFYRFKANAFVARDAGFNTLDTSDDTEVHGVDVYGSLTHRLRLGPRTTWTNTAGVGASLYDRDHSEVISEDDFKNGVPVADTDYRAIDGMRFVDEDEFHIGNSDRTISPDDTDSYYVFADYTSRLNHRFSDFLTGYLQYKVRRGIGEGLGNYYERIGKQEAFGDIYDFYTDKHMLEGGMDFFLRYPNLTAYVNAGENLDTDSDIFPYEIKRFAGTGMNYTNQTREFTAGVSSRYTERQMYDMEDPDAFKSASINNSLDLSYYPRHARYWAALSASQTIQLDSDPNDTRDERQRRRFDDNDDDYTITPTIGRKFGPKYRAQIGASYDSEIANFKRIGLTILRDLHDAELGLFLGARNNAFEEKRDNDDDTSDRKRVDNWEPEIRVGLKFKLGRDQPGLGQRSITTLSDLRREAQYVE